MLCHSAPTLPIPRALLSRTVPLPPVSRHIRLSRHRIASVAMPERVENAGGPQQPPIQESQTSTEVTQQRPQPWWMRPLKGAEFFQEITNVEDLTEALSVSKAEGKYVVIDFFAGNCPSCKAAYPKLCSIAKDPKLRQCTNFYKANVQDPTLFWWIKRNGVTSIPYFLVFSPDGKQILSTTASFKRMPVIKEGMHEIISNPQATRFGLNAEKTKIEVLS